MVYLYNIYNIQNNHNNYVSQQQIIRLLKYTVNQVINMWVLYDI